MSASFELESPAHFPAGPAGASGQRVLSLRAGPSARCAPARSIPPDTSARGATVTSSRTREPDLLARGAITTKGRLPGSSNVTLLVELTLGDARGLAVYKPVRGERPLWDFP